MPLCLLVFLDLIIPKRENVLQIHAKDMKVHAYTFRNEYQHLNWNYGQDPYVEYEHYLQAGLDGYFTDFSASLNR